MILFGLFIVLVLNYGWETMRNRAIRQERDQDPESTLLLDDRLTRGMPISPAVEAARRRLFAASDDPVIENQRRMTLASFFACAALLPIWALSSEAVDRTFLDVAHRSLIAFSLLVGSLVVGLVSGRTLIKGVLGPDREFHQPAVAGVVFACSVVAFAALLNVYG